MRYVMKRAGTWILLSACVVLVAAGSDSQTTDHFQLVPRLVFSSTRDSPDNPARFQVSEIYLTNPDGTNPQRLTFNSAADLFAELSPDGKKIVFDSNRYHLDTGEPRNTSDLFLMDTDGDGQVLLTRGSSASWSPDGKSIAFHASASYYASGGLVTGLPIRTDPGSATSDSDIFLANVDDLLSNTAVPRNLTNSPDMIDDDADWAPDGTRIAFTSHPVTDNPTVSNHAEIYVMNVDGSGLQQLTHNDYEERAPTWSPDSTRIAFMCPLGPVNPKTGVKFYELCLMNADGSGFVQLTYNPSLNAAPSWSPDGQKIVFHRNPPPYELWVIDLRDLGCDPSTGTCTCNNPALNNPTYACATPLTSPPGENGYPKWGMLRIKLPR